MALDTSYYLGSGVSLNLNYIAHDLADDLSNEDLIELILMMDLRKADMDFTQRLYAAIGDELRKELEADERT